MVLPSTDYFLAISTFFEVCLIWIIHPCDHLDVFSDFGLSGSSVMDSDRSSVLSSASPAAKILHCQCGRRMSSFTRDFHAICIECWGLDF